MSHSICGCDCCDCCDCHVPRALIPSPCHALQVYWREKCFEMTGTEINHRSSFCKSGVFNQPIWVDLHAFETAIINAAVHVGINLKARGVEPVKDNATLTGWRSNYNDIFGSS